MGKILGGVRPQS